uniref:Uracil phosphoribosyltransferase or UMP pyrophosphorylase n=1 Tax=Mastocarpus papillatus TaxID=31436 RepID=A0A342RZB8_9FLOR|nr:uracil phosphoribosyltransferase or UMP pyrophosphorylase [Mastocarpus papillatus]AOL58064.1 uracil phosphoribosyltransferase or UMP pyrophosphorylase [Mastocarpus papillatus]
MNLNVYLVSHPIIKKLSNHIIYTKFTGEQIYKYNTKLLGILLIYEIIRKWIKIHNIYIKNIDLTKEISIFDSKESYLVIANLMECHEFISDINIIAPKVFLQHINFNIEIRNCYIDNDIINTIKEQKIIIIERFLNNDSIIKLLDYLLLEKNVNINQIKIMCITCTNNICEHLGNRYKSLKIYTTRIYNY